MFRIGLLGIDISPLETEALKRFLKAWPVLIIIFLPDERDSAFHSFLEYRSEYCRL